MTRSQWLLVLAVPVLCAVGWSGVLDRLSTEYLDAALLGSGAVYATARGINALVSVLQGTEVNAFLLTFTVGELLDPVNDLVERFSAVMMVALGALALQKILLVVVSHVSFNILLTALGVLGMLAAMWGTRRQAAIATRLFLVMVVLRFALALVVLANSWVDAVFLKDNEAVQYQAVQGFHGELNAASDLADGSARGLSALDIRQRIAALGDQVSDFAASLINLLMSLVLKSILLPLGFFYLALALLRRLLNFLG